ncbi:MAG: M28 family peptidase [Bacteroidia bacterium]
MMQNYLQKIVKTLCEIQPPRNFKNPKSLNFIADFLANEWEEMGFQNIERQVFEVALRADLTVPYQNVIAKYNAKNETSLPILVAGAHYDVFGNFQGADDNASAVAGLMGLAKLIQERQPKLPFQVHFVAFTLEEPPFFATEQMGSFIHAKSCKIENKNIIGMINFEMIGYYSDLPNSQGFPLSFLKWFYPTTGNFITVASNFASLSFAKKFKKAFAKNTDLPIELFVAPQRFGGLDFSDHRNYWAMNYPAIMITDTSFFRNPNYHTAKDTPNTLNYEKMEKVVEGTYSVVCGGF